MEGCSCLTRITRRQTSRNWICPASQPMSPLSWMAMAAGRRRDTCLAWRVTNRACRRLKKVTIAASDMGVKVLSLYAFSTENWKRPESEVSYLMDLPIRFFNTFVPDLVKHNVKVTVMGDITRLPEKTQTAVNDAMADTKDCDGMILNFALNYGARDEIKRAVQTIAQQAAAGELDPASITEDTISGHLMSAQLGEFADPDLLIRTSGEERISNFMLWQIAYSELLFVPEHWPDFDGETLKRCLIDFQGRHRRFGGLVNK